MKKITIFMLLFAGFIVAMAIMAFSIYYGYCAAYSASAEQYTVSILGLPIYKLTRAGEGYSAVSIGPNMGIVCASFMAASFAIGWVLHKIRSAD